MLSDFLGSSEFSRVNNLAFVNAGNIDLNLSSIDYVDNNVAKPVLNLVYKANGNVVAFLQVIPIPKHIENVLPNNEHYAMLKVDYQSYNTITKTGEIKLVDLNYDNFLAGELKIDNSAIKEIKGNDMPFKLVAKYSSLKKKSDLGNPKYLVKSLKNHFCDANGNGNVGYGECMSCMTSACNGASTCAAFCAIINVAGIGTSIGGQCTLSMLAACTYIAIVY